MAISIRSLVFSLAVASVATGLHAQSSSGNCGILTWSQADQKYSVLPCSPEAQQSVHGSTQCGIVTWSQADQKHAVVPCTASNGGNGQSCTQRVWAQADQRHVTVPCDTANSNSLSAPVHFGE